MENNPDQPTDPQPGHRPGTDPAKRLPEQSRSFVQYSGIAFQMLGTIGLGVFVGLKIDEWQQNARPIWTNPDCRFETGLGVFATTSMNVWRNLGLVRQMVSKRPTIDAKHVVRDDDVPQVAVTSDTPIATQIDGEYIGLRENMTFQAVPEALGVVAPPSNTPSDLQ